MERILKLIYGYIMILVKGEQLERFLNLCRNRKVYMERIRYINSDQLTAQLNARDFLRLRPIRSKTGVHIQIMEKRGMPFFFFRNKKRKAFFAGLLLGCILIFFMTGRIWNIHIEGNVRNSTGEILDFLEEQGVVHGMSKKKVNCSEIAAAVRRKFQETTWVSARIEGTRLILEIQEGTAGKETARDASPCDLTAEKDGVIAEMIVRAGVPVKKPGDTCEKGELLVSGELHIMNDSQEIVRNEYIHADADIFISRQISYYQEFPMKYSTEIPSGNTKKGIYFRIGPWYLELYQTAEEKQRCITEEYPLRITENFVLPVWGGRAEVINYIKKEELYTQEEARQEAGRRFQQYEKKLLQNGIKITDNHVTTKVTDQLCITRGTLQIIEQTGKESAINIKAREETSESANEQ